VGDTVVVSKSDTLGGEPGKVGVVLGSREIGVLHPNGDKTVERLASDLAGLLVGSGDACHVGDGSGIGVVVQSWANLGNQTSSLESSRGDSWANTALEVAGIASEDDIDTTWSVVASADAVLECASIGHAEIPTGVVHVTVDLPVAASKGVVVPGTVP